MTRTITKIIILLLAVALLTAPAVATDTEISAVVSALEVHVDDNVRNIGYTANRVSNADWIPVLSASAVVFVPNHLLDGAVFKAIEERGGVQTPHTGSAITIEGFSATTSETIHVYLSMDIPPAPEKPSWGSTFISGIIPTIPPTVQPSETPTPDVQPTTGEDDTINPAFPSLVALIAGLGVLAVLILIIVLIRRHNVVK